MQRKIGVIGGMGPLATQLFYEMVTERTAAKTDQDHPEMVIISDTAMPDRTEAILSGDEKEKQMIIRKLKEDAGLLKNCGCELAVITCNTAHYFADIIGEDLGIELIHMINEAAAYTVMQEGVGLGDRVAILATDGTIKAALYQRALAAEGLTPYIPSQETQKLVMYQIYWRIKSGLDWDEEAWKTIDQELRNAGCKKALLACTELSVIGKRHLRDSFYIDAMEVLAEKAIRRAGYELKEKDID